MTRDPFDADPFADGYVEEPPAPEPRSVLAYATPSWRQRVGRRPFLQVAHRLAVLAGLALVTAAGLALYRRAEYWHLLLVAFVAADLTLLLALIASWLRPAANDTRRREPLGLIVFSILLLIPTMVLVTAAKQDRLGAWIDATWALGGKVEVWAEQRLDDAATRSKPTPASLPPGAATP